MPDAIALLIHVVQLLTGESDLTIRTLSSPDYDGVVAFICAVLDNGATHLLFRCETERRVAVGRDVEGF